MAIPFACDMFHYFVYGRRFIMQSDHKPLESLLKRKLTDVSVRLHKLMMKLLKYDHMEVVFRPGNGGVYG